jgi:hypothetical protein
MTRKLLAPAANKIYTFGELTGACVADGGGNFYVHDRDKMVIWKISAGGAVSQFADVHSVGRKEFFMLAVDSSNYVYATGYFDNYIRRWSPSGGAAEMLGNRGAAPYGIVVQGGFMYIVKYGTNEIVKMTKPPYPEDGLSTVIIIVIVLACVVVVGAAVAGAVVFMKMRAAKSAGDAGMAGNDAMNAPMQPTYQQAPQGNYNADVDI